MIGNVKIIGICGRSGSGKGYICKAFEEYGIPSVDTDAVYREILDRDGSSCLKEITSFFGDCVIDSAGKLDRRALAAIVFSDESGKSLEKLNSITHKYILEETNIRISDFENQGYRAVIIDAPVLFESKFNEFCDLIFAVSAPFEVSVERICLRDNRSRKEAVSRLESQLDEETLERLCDEIIINDGVSDVNMQVASITKKYGLGGTDHE